MEGSQKLRILSYVVIAYMLMAFSWWSVLLFVKNDDAFQAKSNYLKLIQVGSHKVDSEETFYASSEYLELLDKYKKQEWMILGEASVFILSLIAGIWLINRGYHNEVQLAKQKRNFLLSVTHELKSPLSAMRLILETIQNRNLNDTQKLQLTQNGIKESDRLNTLVNNLLTATRMETMYNPQKENFNLSKLVREEIERLKQNYPSNYFNTTLQKEEIFVDADKAGVISIINNLVENAVKYSTTETSIEICLESDQKDAILSIKDKGLGVPLAERQLIFSQFYRIGNEETRNTKGTGLGLYIVKQILTAHNGRISIKENTPKGSIFVVKLPLK